MTLIEMDEPREIVWDFAAIKNFERGAKEVLRRQGVNVSQHIAKTIFINYGKQAEIIEVAVGAATRLSYVETKGQPSPAAEAIQGYLSREGTGLDDLAMSLYKAFLEAADPSFIPILEIDEEENAQKKIMKLEALLRTLKLKSPDSGESSTT